MLFICDVITLQPSLFYLFVGFRINRVCSILAILWHNEGQFFVHMWSEVLLAVRNF